MSSKRFSDGPASAGTKRRIIDDDVVSTIGSATATAPDSLERTTEPYWGFNEDSEIYGSRTGLRTGRSTSRRGSKNSLDPIESVKFSIPPLWADWKPELAPSLYYDGSLHRSDMDRYSEGDISNDIYHKLTENLQVKVERNQAHYALGCALNLLPFAYFAQIRQCLKLMSYERFTTVWKELIEKDLAILKPLVQSAVRDPVNMDSAYAAAYPILKDLKPECQIQESDWTTRPELVLELARTFWEKDMNSTYTMEECRNEWTSWGCKSPLWTLLSLVVIATVTRIPGSAASDRDESPRLKLQDDINVFACGVTAKYKINETHFLFTPIASKSGTKRSVKRCAHFRFVAYFFHLILIYDKHIQDTLGRPKTIQVRNLFQYNKGIPYLSYNFTGLYSARGSVRKHSILSHDIDHPKVKIHRELRASQPVNKILTNVVRTPRRVHNIPAKGQNSSLQNEMK